MNSPEVRHELRTPVNLIIGYCEILLGSESSPLAYPHREQVEGIYRNAKQLQTLIENLFSNPSMPLQGLSTPMSGNDPVPDPEQSIVLMDEDETAIESLSIHEPNIKTVHSLEEIGRMGKGIQPAAILVNKADSFDVPVIAQLAGKQTPVVVFDLPRPTQETRLHGARGYMMKPVQFEALSSTLHQFCPSLEHVLVVDDSVDSATMMAHMVRSMPEHPQVWNAYSGQEALALLRESVCPDAIILDFVLPDMNGLLLLDYLQAEGSTSRIPVFIVSAHRMQDVIEPPKVTKLTVYVMGGMTLPNVVNYSRALVSG